MSIYSSAVKRPVTTALIFVAIAIIGLFSLSRISTDLYPKIEVKTIMVVTSYSGAGAEDIENTVSRPLENILNGISNVKHIRSVSKDNYSTVMVEFKEDANLDVATNDIRDKLDLASNILPKGVNKPLIFKFSSDDIPVMMISVKAKQSTNGLSKLIDDNMRTRIARISGVGAVNLNGAPKREIKIYCDPYKLEAYGLSVSRVAQAIQASNKDIPIGTIDMGSKTVSIRVKGEASASKELKHIIVGNYQGKYIYLSDIAELKDDLKERMQEGYTDGQRGGLVMVYKQSGANAVAVCENVKAMLPGIKKAMPKDVSMIVVFDSSEFINNTMDSLLQTLLITFLVVILVVLFFLGRWRATFIIILTIPISLIASFIYLYGSGNTLNIISMSALSIAIGMVVDDAIVVLENITKHIERGAFLKQAAVFATNEVAISVVASTLTMLAVFLPLTLIGGFIGLFFRQLGFIVSIVMIVSTVAALTLTPMLSSKMLARKPHNSTLYNRVFGTINKGLDRLTNHYTKVLYYCIHHRTLTICAAVAIFIGSFFLLPLLKTEFMPQSDQGFVSGELEFAPGTRMEIVRDFGKKFMAELDEKYGKDILSSNYTVGSADENDPMAALFAGDANMMQINIKMIPYGSRSITSLTLANNIRDMLKKYPEIEISSVRSGGRNGGLDDNGVSVEIYGYDIPKTTKMARAFADKIRASGVVSEAVVSRKGEVPQYRIIFDEDKLAMYGLNKTSAANELRSAVNGVLASNLREDGEEYDIRVRYAPKYRTDIDAILNILIPTATGSSVRLRDLAELKERNMPPFIERKDRERYVSINCVPSKGHALSDVVSQTKKIMSELPPQSGISYKIAGAYEKQQKSFGDLGTLLLLIMILVYIVMAAQFESFADPFVIILSVFFAFTGVILGLLFTGTPLGVMALIGSIMLVGIVVKNGIVLIDYTRLCRERGMGVHQSVLSAGRSRLRPVLMTTATTVLGMIPLAIGIGEGSEIWSAMGMTVATGLTFSTLVTLVLIPTVYTSFRGIAIKRARKRDLKMKRKC